MKERDSAGTALRKGFGAGLLGHLDELGAFVCVCVFFVCSSLFGYKMASSAPGFWLGQPKHSEPLFFGRCLYLTVLGSVVFFFFNQCVCCC